MTKLSTAQVSAAHGRMFEAPGVFPGCPRVVFCGIWPSGNVGVKKAGDPDTHGPLTVSPVAAEPLLKAIAEKFNKRGFRVTTTAARA